MHRITHLLLSSLLLNPKLDEATFCATLPELDEEQDRPSTALQILGRSLTEEDYRSENVVCASTIVTDAKPNPCR